MRKSFVIHIDSLDVLDDLSDEQAGQLFRAIKAFQKGEDISLEPMVKIAFSPLKNQFIRDNEKYKKTCERRAEAGSKGGLAKASKSSKTKQTKANLAENKNKNKNKNKSKSDNKNNIISQRKFTDDDLKTSHFIFSKVKSLNAKAKEPNFDSWSNTVRLMREQDKLTHREICEVFSWANQDSFWQSNILSPEKLRKQFNQLQIKMGGSNGHQTISNQPSKPSLQERVKQKLAAREAELRESGRLSDEVMAEINGDVRTQDDQPIWGSSERNMGEVLEGDYTHSDS